MLTGAAAKLALTALVFLVAAFIGLRNYKGGHLADEIMKEADESDEELLERLIRREATAAAKKLGVSQTEAKAQLDKNGTRVSSKSAKAFFVAGSLIVS